MFRPNTKCLLLRRRSTRNIFGKTMFATPTSVPCSVVKLELAAETSSVRADSTASRGAAEQEEAAAVFLFPANMRISINDVINYGSFQIRVTKLIPRNNVAGKLDHIQVEGVIKVQATWARYLSASERTPASGRCAPCAVSRRR
jgi:hypothetical protein